jgi:hypothetical protein
MTGPDFKTFDRSLSDFRDATAIAHETMRKAIDRYITMMDALDAAFLLYYENMTPDELAKMTAAFDKLASTVQMMRDQPSNVYPMAAPRR